MYNVGGQEFISSEEAEYAAEMIFEHDGNIVPLIEE